MDKQTAEILCKMNTDFYQGHFASFAQTRARPWPGWKECLPYIERLCSEGNGTDDLATVAGRDGVGGGSDNIGALSGTLSVFDLACGNLRFELFLQKALAETFLPPLRPSAEGFAENARAEEFPLEESPTGFPLVFHVVDNCEDLVSVASDSLSSDFPSTTQIHFQNLDIVGHLLRGDTLGDRLDAPICDLSVCFGFFHHVPLLKQREEVLKALVGQTRSGGLLIVTLWQFSKDAVMKEKARAIKERAMHEWGLQGLGENDYLLGWKNMPGVYRYCHSFSDDEIDCLVESLAGKVEMLARFTADGRTDSLNAYLILRVR